MKKDLTERFRDIEELAKEMGLDFFPVVFETVNREIMLEACTYGLPQRGRHYSYGSSYDRQKIFGENNWSRTYEIIFNNNPAYAYLMENNSEAVNLMVAAHCFGHCIKYDQLVETIGGAKQISDITAGDLVLTHSGKFKRVSEAKETSKTNEIYKIKTYGYPEVECTSDHKFYIQRDGANMWMAAKDILQTDFIAIPRRIPQDKIKSVNVPIVVSRTTPLRKKAIKDIGYNFELNYDFGRIVGLYLAEGGTNINRFEFSFGATENEFAAFVKEYFERFGVTVVIKLDEKDHSLVAQCFDKSLAGWFDNTFGRGCCNKHIPINLIQDANYEFYKGLIRGYFEGDGWIKDFNRQASASTTSIKLAYQIKDLCAMFGVKVGVSSRERENRRKNYDLAITGINYDMLLSICNIKRSNPPKRRWLFNRVDNSFIYNKVRSIDKVCVDDVPMWDLEVEDDHSFVLSNGAIAHNCHFFKNNILFKDSDRGMVVRAAERANRVDQYIEKYGIDKVEHLMDIGFALDRHIDFSKGIYRSKYPKKRTVNISTKSGDFDDLFAFGNHSKRIVSQRTVGEKLPPHPEKDLLWFLINYAPLEEWECEILGYMREESHYFWPIVATKIANEGFACVLGNTPVYTENGLMEMKDIILSDKQTIFDGNDKKKIVHSGIFKDRDTIKITTKRGLYLCGADNHRIIDLDGNWRQLNDIVVGDKVKISGGGNIWPKDKQKINVNTCRKESRQVLCKKYGISRATVLRYLNKTHTTKPKNTKIIEKILEAEETQKCLPFQCIRKVVKYPKIMDEDFGSFLGYLIGDGHISMVGRSFGLTTGDDAQADDFIRLANTLFGVSATKRWDNSSKNGRWRVTVYAQDLSKFFINDLGMHFGLCAREKEIPQIILRSPKSVVSAFLRAYYDCDGCASEKCGVILSTSSDKLAEQTQVILLNYGILSYRHKAKDDCWQVRICGESAKLFGEEIGFGLQRKQEKLKKYIENRKWFCGEKWEDTVVKIEQCGKQDVYDVSVEESHRYAAAGFINHNSFCHAELMLNYPGLTETEHLEFAKVHSSVINPGSNFNLNPYFIGFKVFADIRKRWDLLHEAGESELTGIQKVLQVAAEEDDASFLRNYLTPELAIEMGLFNYGYRHKREQDEEPSEDLGLVELKDRDLNKIIDHIIRPTINYGVPEIVIEEMDGERLVMRHTDKFGELDTRYTEKTLEMMYELWSGPIELITYDGDGCEIVYCFDENGFGTI